MGMDELKRGNVLKFSSLGRRGSWHRQFVRVPLTSGTSGVFFVRTGSLVAWKSSSGGRGNSGFCAQVGALSTLENTLNYFAVIS